MKKQNQNNISIIIKKIVGAILVYLLLIFVTLTSYLYVNQNSLIFFPRPLNEQVISVYKQENGNIKDISIKTSDNNTLNGWLINNAGGLDKKPLIIYFGGNAEEVSSMARTANKVSNWTWALVNYRGYGSSTGSPSEENLFNDSVLVYDYLRKRENIDNRKIIVFGRSLGTGVAMYLAQNRQISGVILVTPYDSMTSVAQENYPFLPVDLLLKHRFDSISRVQYIKTPVLIMAAENDQTIRPIHTERLVKEFGERCTYKVIESTGHITISASDLYLKYITDFLNEVK